MLIHKEKHFSADIENGEHENLDADQLRDVVKQVFKVDEDDIDALTDEELQEQYGEKFQKRVKEETTGVKFIVEPGWQAVESYVNQIKRWCRDNNVKTRDITSGMVTGDNFFGEALIIEVLGSADILKVREYLENME